MLILGGCTDNSATKEDRNLIPMVMVNGVLYLDTGHINNNSQQCGTPNGKIISKVNENEKPTIDNQSNFGIDYYYLYGETKGTIEIFMDNKWHIFAIKEKEKADDPYVIDFFLLNP